VITKALHKKKSQNSFKDFYAEISKYLPKLENFTRAKIKIAENEGSIKTGYYTINDILDDVYWQVYKDFSKEMKKESLQIVLFLKTISKLDEIKELESHNANSISTSTILNEELNLLEERYSVDGGGDFILEDEFDAISYHQKYFKQTPFILNEVLEDKMIGKVFNKDEATSLSIHRKDIPKIFHNLPPSNTGIILELYIFGELNTSEISKILGIKKQRIMWIISSFLKEFKQNI